MTACENTLVTVYVITYRRPRLLARALGSLAGQTCARWQALVVNDDPADGRVAEVVASCADPRIRLFEPVSRRGAAANFNLAFMERTTPFAAILEDDNWWQPEFLATMIDALGGHPRCGLACGNERVWRERADGGWEDTGTVIWPETEGVSEWTTTVETACGAAKLCNSSMLFSTRDAGGWLTPDDIPVDVTEHFRERCVPQPILLVHAPMVNYAETLVTNRSTRGTSWADYQCLLVGSCFHAAPAAARPELARRLWRGAGGRPSPRATSLLLAALAVPEARALWTTSSGRQRVRFLATMARRLPGVVRVLRVKQRLRPHWDFLCATPFNRLATWDE